MLRTWLMQRSALIEELKEQNELLRQENKALYERIIQMASSVPHIRIAGQEELEIETTSPLATFDEDQPDLRTGNKGAGVV